MLDIGFESEETEFLGSSAISEDEPSLDIAGAIVGVSSERTLLEESFAEVFAGTSSGLSFKEI